MELPGDGDYFEQVYWDEFLRDEWPSYGVVWKQYVVQLTLRPERVAFKSDAELAQIGRGPADIHNIQLHYTAFTHLHRVFELRRSGFNDDAPFFEAIVRLAAATDVADDLLQRLAQPGTYPAWDERPAARRAWRRAHAEAATQEIRDYRNRMLHGAFVPFTFVSRLGRITETGEEVPAVEPALRFPRLSAEPEFLDWRRMIGPHADATRAQAEQRFETAERIVEEAWSRTLEYLERQWQAYVIPATA